METLSPLKLHQFRCRHNLHPRFPLLSAASTNADTTPLSMLDPVWLQITFFFSDFRASQRRLLVVVFPLVPQTTKMLPRTCSESSLRMSGQMMMATCPAQVTPCFPARRQTVPISFAAHMARLLRTCFIILNYRLLLRSWLSLFLRIFSVFFPAFL